VDSFIKALNGLVEYCGYARLHNKVIQDRIVVGLREPRLPEKLQLDPELTLEKAVTQVWQAERQQSLMQGTSANHKQPDTHVGAVQKQRPARPMSTDELPRSMMSTWIVLQRLQEAGFMLNLQKCYFSKS